MNITPSNTWAIRSLVETLRINAEDVSVISAGAKKTPSLAGNSNPSASQTDDSNLGPLNNGAEPRRAGRKRKHAEGHRR